MTVWRHFRRSKNKTLYIFGCFTILLLIASFVVVVWAGFLVQDTMAAISFFFVACGVPKLIQLAFYSLEDVWLHETKIWGMIDDFDKQLKAAVEASPLWRDGEEITE